MAISKLGVSAGSDNWELISSVTTPGSVTAVNFTGLSVYRKLALRWFNVELTGTGTFRVRLNNDSGTNYDTSYVFYTAGYIPVVVMGVSDFRPINSNVTQQSGFLEIINCDNTGVKFLVNGYIENEVENTNLAIQHYGIYRASAVITQVNLILSTITTGAGTVALYGVK